MITLRYYSYACFLALQLGSIRFSYAAEFKPAPQRFLEEVATRFGRAEGVPEGGIRLLDVAAEGSPRIFANGNWLELRAGRWQAVPELAPRSEQSFVFSGVSGEPITVSLPWAEVLQVLRRGQATCLVTAREVYAAANGQLRAMDWGGKGRINQVAVSTNGTLVVASSGGLFEQTGDNWSPISIFDGLGRGWAVQEVLGVAFDDRDRLWFACKAGAGCREDRGWRFYEGKDGLPWNDFTGMTAGLKHEMWFGTHLGAIRFDEAGWHYRQGPLWLPDDDVRQIMVDAQNRTWIATATGLGLLEQRPLTLAQKAAFYEAEIARFIKRTAYGYVAEAALRKPGDKTTADPQDSDNDGLWTAMYGAGECFAYAATHDPQAKERAAKAFEALRFLQKVTQGGMHAPPKGYVARTIRPTTWPDPNVGRLAQDREAQKRDSLWKVYEPRWPKSADGQWYWKSDTSSDELDGHFFFYLQYFDLCADSDSEKARVREVVRDLADHLIEHRFALVDHDGRPTRWGIFGPDWLNRDPRWWPERGLNSLSMLSYLAVAAHVTGEAKYESASRQLIDQDGYGQNVMYPKVQHGPGSGNQSDDEMAFMCYYDLLRCSKDEKLKAQVRYSFFGYWANEAPEMNPFFNFAYAAQNLQSSGASPFGHFALTPWKGWFEDAMATLYGFPLDRLNWPHRNSHRLDIVALRRPQAEDLSEVSEKRRGYRVSGKVLPVENRHFNHWNTDPWQLDYGGGGNELAAGTVFLLPYYLGLYHGFIEKP